MIIPLRGGPEGLVIRWDIEEFAATVPRANVEIERIWAGLLTVVRDSWPDWPVEVWGAVEEVERDEDDAEGDSDAEAFSLSFAVFFGSEDRTDKTAASMASFVLSAIHKALPLEPSSSWGTIDPTWKPLWTIDDAQVVRLFAPEATLDESVYLLGSYAGRPAWFAAALEAWPLVHTARDIGIELHDCDVSWAFG